jgi:hypothetical protein
VLHVGASLGRSRLQRVAGAIKVYSRLSKLYKEDCKGTGKAGRFKNADLKLSAADAQTPDVQA